MPLPFIAFIHNLSTIIHTIRPILTYLTPTLSSFTPFHTSDCERHTAPDPGLPEDHSDAAGDPLKRNGLRPGAGHHHEARQHDHGRADLRPRSVLKYSLCSTLCVV